MVYVKVIAFTRSGRDRAPPLPVKQREVAVLRRHLEASDQSVFRT